MHAPPAGVRAGAPLHWRGGASIPNLLGKHADGETRFEASGVTRVGDRLLVVFDNLHRVARLDLALTPGAGRLVGPPDTKGRYEDIAHDAQTGRVFAVIEDDKDDDGERRPRIDELSRLNSNSAGLVDRKWVDVVVPRNKGLEGLTCVRRHGALYLLGLLEDSGRVVVLREGGQRWEVVDEIRLPTDLDVRDYAGLSVRVDPNAGGRGDPIAVVSQESSALWVGRLDPEAWWVSDAGRTYHFPRDDLGRVIYGNVEGVVWLDDSTVVAVSDIPKRDDPPEFRATAASVHVFAIPA